jgi:hypothetical protein
VIDDPGNAENVSGKGKVALTTGSGLASLVAVALIGAVDAAQGQEAEVVPATEVGACPSPDKDSAGVEATDASDAAAGQADPADAECAPEPDPSSGAEGEPDPPSGGGSETEPGSGPAQPGPAPTPPSPEPNPVGPPTPPASAPTGDVTASAPQTHVGPAAGGRGHGHRQHDAPGGRGNDRRDDSDYTPRDRNGGSERARNGGRSNGKADRDEGDAGAHSGTAHAYGPVPSGYPGFGGAAIPPELVPLYQECGNQYGIPWRVLAAINQVETAFGSNLNVSSAGAVGWMQFMPSTWAAYGVDADGDGRRNPYDPRDAICSAARYLRASGAHYDMRRALFAYNHADWYVDMVLALARSYAGVSAADPLPAAKRLDRGFARELARVAREHDVDWAILLATLRAQGETGRVPARLGEVRTLAERLADAERPRLRDRLALLVRSLFGDRPRFEQRVIVLARYNSAVGLRGLVEGMHAVHHRLAGRVLESNRLEVYAGGRDDIANGRIDPRVLALMLYLADKYDGVSVTSLVSGHSYYSRPGVPSAHAFGEAVDIAAIRGKSILGNQQPGGITDQAVRDILALPAELRPAQVISLLDFGGPSFAAADHHDHVHVGF